MTIGQHAEVFYGQPVKAFESPGDWAGPDYAYRLAITWDDRQEDLYERADQLVGQEGVDQMQAIIIGAWTGDDSSYGSEEIVKGFAKHRRTWSFLLCKHDHELPRVWQDIKRILLE